MTRSAFILGSLYARCIEFSLAGFREIASGRGERRLQRRARGRNGRLAHVAGVLVNSAGNATIAASRLFMNSYFHTGTLHGSGAETPQPNEWPEALRL